MTHHRPPPYATAEMLLPASHSFFTCSPGNVGDVFQYCTPRPLSFDITTAHTPSPYDTCVMW